MFIIPIFLYFVSALGFSTAATATTAVGTALGVTAGVATGLGAATTTVVLTYPELIK